MGYRSEVFAAVAGSQTSLATLIQSIKPFESQDEQEIFSDFKLIEMEKDCWFYAFHYTDIKWYTEPENVWRVIREHARLARLSYVFYRLGDDFEDVEVDECCAEKAAKFYQVLTASVSLRRSIDVDDRVRSVF